MFGAPVGNQNAKKGLRWRKALERALARASEKGDVDSGLDAIADQVVALAKAGDKDAYTEIGNRMDGKAVQALEHSGADGEPLPTRITVELTKPDA